MKKLFFIMLFIIVAAAAGCQQRQEPKSKAAYPAGPASMITPEQINNLEGIAKANPKNANAWIAFGNALYDSSRCFEAVEAYRKALALDSKNVDVRVDMGTCYRNIGKPDKALEEYRKALMINPAHAFAHRNSGVVLAYDLNDKAQAAKEFERYLELAPNAQDAAEVRELVKNLKAGR